MVPDQRDEDRVRTQAGIRPWKAAEHVVFEKNQGGPGRYQCNATRQSELSLEVDELASNQALKGLCLMSYVIAFPFL
jgi:hypothetical protein